MTFAATTRVPDVQALKSLTLDRLAEIMLALDDSISAGNHPDVAQSADQSLVVKNLAGAYLSTVQAYITLTKV